MVMLVMVLFVLLVKVTPNEGVFDPEATEPKALSVTLFAPRL